MAMVLSGRSYTRAFERGLPPNATIEQIEQLFHRLPPDATIEQIEQLFHHCSATAKPKILIALKKKQSAGYDIEDLIAAVERLILMDMPPSSSIKVRNSCARL